MPLSAEHKERTRARIIETARILFNLHGLRGVTIDMVMREAGLTRGGFYNHFKNKDELYSAAVHSFLHGRGAQWRDEAGIDLSRLSPEMAQHMLDSYLSEKHLGDLENQCPMIALPSDVARAGEEVQNAYHALLTAMVWLFESAIEGADARSRALAMAALAVGGMVLARTLPGSDLADEVRLAAHQTASRLKEAPQPAP
ncbi:TetR/AcrR family transcriptional regulator [Actibacterium sp. 188UL27-1]|uniref:TetR/AcrR family transcriptional regulator n=1 Tax=Actibacterium sp. 188UL27-1 TaxID=2786961 RepID=UPI0019596646|nr:TetR/AcrR family transcriptional regulator [Actibacterium sp. 188UL27-1]MBM7070155.1 TetR/AcrR family transcriptional regulator [Actibacterium sp. 188UL27-1]